MSPPQSHRKWQLKTRVLRFSIWLLCVVGVPFFIAVSSYAQFPLFEKAPVVINGRPLFEVAQTNQVKADERAENISQELEERVGSGDALEATTELRNQAPVILVNDRYLMTVTQEDAELNNAESTREQAKVWADLLNQELEAARQELSQAALQRRFVIAISALGLAFLAHQLIGLLWQRSLHHLLQRFTNPLDNEHNSLVGSHLFSTLMLVVLRCSLWFGVLTYITNLFPFTRRWNYFLRRQVLVGFLEPTLRLGQNEFSVLSLVILLGMVLGVVILSGVFTNFLRFRVLHLTGITRGSREAISVLVKYSLIFVGVVVLLQIWGLDLSSLALIASALGVGIGLGLQNIAKDFGSGLILVFERPIQVGDFVEFGQFQGTVEHIGARSTEIKTLDKISIIVPNSRFLEQEVINWSHRNPVSRIRLPVGVAYSSKPNVVREVLMNVSYQHPDVLSTPEPLVFFTGFGESALEFQLLVSIASPPKQLIIKSQLYFAIEAALREHKIEIPFPQRDLHVRSGHLPIQMSPDILNHGSQPPNQHDHLPSAK